MEPDAAKRFAKIDEKLNDVEKKFDDRERQIKIALLPVPAGQSSALWAKLKLVPGRNETSTDPNDYEIILERSFVSDEQWKLEVNDRYQKAVASIVTLATLALGGPFIFLKSLNGESLKSVFTNSALLGEGLLGISVVCAVLYYFFSAKWVKLALANKADFFKINLRKDFVEFALDGTYFLMMIGFLVGTLFVVKFMITYVPPVPLVQQTSSQDQLAQSTHNQDVKDLEGLEAVWNKAHENGDANALEALWADDFEVAVPLMPVMTRAEALKFARSGRMKFLRYATSEVRVLVDGNAAVVTGRLQRTRLMRGKEVSDDWRFTKTYLRNAQKWKVTAFHASEASVHL